MNASTLNYTNNFIPPPGSFSACIMFKDDSRRMVEWLAYHYHVLPLRDIVIGVDPTSSELPPMQPYLQRMKITVWSLSNDDTFSALNRNAVNRHRRRQTFFLRQCALHLKARRRRWTAFLDPDEYLLFRYPSGTTPLNSPPDAMTKSNVPEEFRSIVAPTVREEGIIYKFLHRHDIKQTQSYTNPCITIPRLLFGNQVAAENQKATKDQRQQQHQIHYSSLRLNTQYYRTHAHRNDFKSNRLAKVILDVGSISKSQLSRLKNIHRMVPEICWNPQLLPDQSLFTINHYLGSKESFYHRKDVRDDLGRDVIYDLYSGVNNGTDDLITPWYDGFVKSQGQEVVDELLSQNLVDKINI